MTVSFLDVVPMLPKVPFRFSFSQWETYDQCPAKWKFGSILKLPRRPPGPAASKGIEVHASVEKYIRGEIKADGLHPAIHDMYVGVFDTYKDHHNGDRWTEKKLAFDADWAICPPTSPYTSCIAILDAVKFSDGVLDIGEWKSGKPKDSHADQRKLYGMTGMRAWYAHEVRVTTYYLENTAPPERFTIKTEEGWQKMKNLWEGRIRTMQRDDMCAPRPSFGCRFCDYSARVGGPCQF